MAVFFHNNRTIPYTTVFAPFAHDLLLLQGSRLTQAFWKPVLDDLATLTASSGRVVTCDWHEKNRSPEELAAELDGLLKTLGLSAIHVVACEDAVEVVTEFERRFSGVFEATLLYPKTLPRTEELVRAIREFSQI